MKDKLINQLKKHEGYRQHPYQDTVGKLTVGYGRNLDDVGITEEEATYLLSNDIQLAEKALGNVFADWQGFTENRQQALLNMIFNLGQTRFMGFKKMLLAIQCGDWEEAAKQALDSRWHKQVGQRARELAEMIRNG